MDAKRATCRSLVLLLAAYITEVTGYRGWDANCGVTKGCFPDCPDGCHYLVTWQDMGSSIQFTMYAEKSRSDSYIAIGFSNDRRMGDDSVVACMIAGIQSSYNKGTDSKALSPPSYGVNMTSVSDNGIDISCDFTRQTQLSDSRFFDLNNDYYIQLVTGEVESKHGKMELKKHDEIPWFSERKVDFQSNEIVGAYKLNSLLVKLHGIVMVLGWLLFSLVGIMTARYNKDMLPETKLFGTKVWFQVHRAVMVAVVVCVVIGFVAIFVEIEGYSQVTPGEPGFVQAHPVLGIVITCFALINPIAALFRPGPDHKFRWIFNWGHLGLGVIGQLLAVSTIFFGYFADRSSLSSTPAIVTAAHIAVVIFFVVFLEVRKQAHAGKLGVENDPISNGDVINEDKPKVQKEKEKQKNQKVPMIVLVVFSIFMCGFAVAILVIIATG